jgi:thiol-disulfide isomerase/thioredoxin
MIRHLANALDARRRTVSAAVSVSFIFCICVVATACSAGSAPQATGQAPLAIGAAAPDFSLPGADGRTHKLADNASAKVLAVVFTCNHCAASELYEARITKLYDDYKRKGVALVAINPNNPTAVRLDEQIYSDVNDGLKDMKARVEYRHIAWPFLYDGETQAVSKKFGPTATPEIFIFDSARKLQYAGRIDDNLNESAVKSHDARRAIDALLAGQPVAAATTTPTGCPIAWLAKAPDVRAELAKIEADPVSLSLAAADDLKKLRENPTGRFLIVNFWATWCGPCIGEFPELQETYRIFRNRGVAFITISENDPEEQKGVLEFLQKQHSTVPNYLFGSSDVYAMQAAFDPNMAAAVPVTLLLAPNGDVLYQQTGDLDVLRLRRTILSNLPDDQSYPGIQAYWSASTG